MEESIPSLGSENIKFISLTRRHWASQLNKIGLILALFFAPIILITAFAIVTPSIFSGVILNFVVAFIAVYYFVMVTFAFSEWVTYYYDVFLIYNDVIIDINQNGIFDRRISEISIIRIQDVSARVNGFLQTFFSYGNVIAESAGEKTQTYVIDCVPNPVQMANTIMELHNKQISQGQRNQEILTGEGDIRGSGQEKEEVGEFEPMPMEKNPPDFDSLNGDNNIEDQESDFPYLS